MGAERLAGLDAQVGVAAQAAVGLHACAQQTGAGAAKAARCDAGVALGGDHAAVADLPTGSEALAARCVQAAAVVDAGRLGA